MAKRVVLAYSGGLDTSVAVRWMIDELGVEVIALRRRRRPGRRRLGRRARAGARRRRGRGRSSSTPARSSPTTSSCPRCKANALYEGRYPLVSALSRPVIVKHLVAAARDARRRRGRPRLHRQGQRPGALRGVDPGARARPRHPRARSATWGMTREDVDPLRLRPRHPDHRDQGEGVLDRRQPLGPRHRVRRDGGPVGGAAAGRVARSRSRRRPSRATSSIGFERACRSRRRRAARPGRAHRPRSTRSSAPTAGAASTWSRTGGSASRAARPTSARRPGADPRPRRPRVDHASSATSPARRRGSSRATPSSSTTACGSRPLKQALDAFVDESQRYVTGEVRLHLEPGRARSPAGAASTASTTTASPPTTPPTAFRHEDSAGFVRLWGLGIETWAAASQGAAAPGSRVDALARPLRRRARPTSCWRSRSACRSTSGWRPTTSPGSRAHVRGLAARRRPRRRRGRRSCSPRSTASRTSWPTARSSSQPTDEDIHTAIERRVTELAGAAGGQAPHRAQPQRPGRHRPAALRQARAGRRSPRRVLELQQVLLERAEEAGRCLPPGLHAPAAGAAGPARAPPAGPRLGAGARRRPAARHAGAGSTCPRSAPVRWPARRCRSTPTATAAELGFAAAFENSLDAVSDRDFVAEALFDLALLGVHLSRHRRGGRAVVERRVRLRRASTTPTRPAAR